MSYILNILLSSTALTVNILIILIAAMTLLGILQQSKNDSRIINSLKSIKQAKELKILTIAIILVSFFEGVAGFGTPGILVPIILVGLGMKALPAICLTLFIDTIVVIHGAIGTPIYAGIQSVVPSSTSDLESIALYSSIAAITSAIPLSKWIINDHIKNHKVHAYFDYALFLIAFLVSSFLFSQISAILTGFFLTGLLLLTNPRTKTWKKHLSSWVPYVVLTAIIVIPKYIPALYQAMQWQISVGFSTLKPLTNPAIAFAITALIFNATYKTDIKGAIAQTWPKICKITPILFIALLATQVIINSNALSYIVSAATRLGDAYIIVVPLLGAIGSALTGSTTVSNILLAASHAEIAQSSQLPTYIILALQNTGGGLGNAISIFNVIAACSIFHTVSIKDVYKKTFLPIITCCIILGIIAWILFR